MRDEERLSGTSAALGAADAVLASARARIGERVAPDGRIDAVRLDAEQIAVHGFAWMATYVEALRQLHGWASRLDEAGEFGAVEALILRLGFGEYLAQIGNGIAMS